MTIKIREVSSRDAAKIINFMTIVGGETNNLTFGAEGLPFTIEQEKMMIKTTHEDPHSIMYGAFDGHHLVGLINLRGFDKRMSHRATLGISIIKAYWGRGIGHSLMSKTIDYAKSHDIEIINLEVRSDNLRAIRLYEKCSFKRIGTFPGYFKINNNYIDFELMCLDLRKTEV